MNALLAGVLVAVIPPPSVDPVPPAAVSAVTPEGMQKAVDRALPLLLKGAEGHAAKRTCFACHNQGIPLLALTTARARGFAVRQEDLKKQVEFIARFLEGNREHYQKGRGQGGAADTAGYALFALDLGGWKADATTEAVVEYLLQWNQNLDHWRTSGHRPPSEASDFSVSYLALRALHRWGTPAQQDRIAKRVDTVRAWLLKTRARDTEDRVFRLWALREVGAEDYDLQAAVRELTRSQRPDGGWSQTDQMDSDAYATGTALVALHQAGGLAVGDPVYRRGVAYLLKAQQGDGSWLVHTRSRPFQTYFESGFPHGKDQFISMAASGWATTALVLGCLPPEAPGRR
jgi:hypothetical protein